MIDVVLYVFIQVIFMIVVGAFFTIIGAIAVATDGVKHIPVLGYGLFMFIVGIIFYIL